MRSRIVVSLLAGVASSWAFPPNAMPLWLLGIVVVFGLVATAHTWREAFWLGGAAAVGFFSLHILWLPGSFSGLLGPTFWGIFPLLLVALALFWGATTAFARAAGGHGLGTLLILAPAWVLVEWLRSLGFLGFPWGTLGYAWTDTPIAQWADVVGVLGLSLFTTVAAALLAAPFVLGSQPTRLRSHYRYGFSRSLSSSSRSSSLRWIGALGSAVLLTSAWWGGSIREANFTAALEVPNRTALLVQGNVDPFGRAVGAALELDIHIDTTLEGMRAAETAIPDLVVWPEGAVLGATLDGVRSEPVRSQIQASAPNAAFLVGGRSLVPGGSTNTVFALEEGDTPARYDKHVLVPFGERWPLLGIAAPVYRGIFSLFGLPLLSNTVPGPGPAAVPVLDLRAGAYICYESVFPRIPIEMVADGATVLVNITNDAWFAWGDGARQHFDMGRMRAIETRRWLLRAGNDGITAVVDPLGRTVVELPRGVRDSLVARYAERSDITPYVVFGDWIPLVLILLTGLAVLWGVVQRW